MQRWIDQFIRQSGMSPQTFARLAQTLAILLILVIVRMIALRIVRKRVHEIKRGYYYRRAVNYTTGFVAVLMVVTTWFTGLADLSTFLGLLSAGLAVALSDLLANFAGWLFILARRPFAVGDRIQIGGQIGDVIDIRLFQTFLLECGGWVDADQSTGRIIMVPNGMVFKNTVANYTHGFEHIWDEIPVLVTFETDWRRAKQILKTIADTHAQPLSLGAQEQIRKAASKHMIFFRNLTPIVYTTVKDSGVMLTIRYLTLPRTRRSSNEAIWEAILDAFEREPTIDLAYPTTRYYRSPPESQKAEEPQSQK